MEKRALSCVKECGFVCRKSRYTLLFRHVWVPYCYLWALARIRIVQKFRVKEIADKSSEPLLFLPIVSRISIWHRKYSNEPIIASFPFSESKLPRNKGVWGAMLNRRWTNRNAKRQYQRLCWNAVWNWVMPLHQKMEVLLLRHFENNF